MINYQKLIHCVLLIVSCMVLMKPSIAQQNSLLTYTFICPDTVRAGDTLAVNVTISIKSDWFVYAPVQTNEQQGMQLTRVIFQALPAGLKRVGPIHTPPYRQKGSFAVYMGDGHKFTQYFVVDKNISANTLTLQVKLVYQACNDQTCYPPITEKLKKNIYIVRE